jgi:predicted N-acetyltransferase YhbS
MSNVRPQMNDLRVLPAELQDASAILDLQRRAYESEAKLYNDWSIPPLTQTLEELVAEFQTNLLLKAVSAARLVGSVRARENTKIVQIGRLVVEPSFQGQGIGSRLLQAIEAAFPSTGEFQLFTGSRSVGNIALYKRHGYAVTHEKVLSPSVTLVCMSKASTAA